MSSKFRSCGGADVDLAEMGWGLAEWGWDDLGGASGVGGISGRV